jgi:putative phage-type endonuclease|tara:strand:+ start:5543 stop:6697 length:1155 start_codon:yes stop_codon:yes gene_type:complete
MKDSIINIAKNYLSVNNLEKELLNDETKIINLIIDKVNQDLNIVHNTEIYVVNNIVQYYIHKLKENQNIYNQRKEKLSNLKKLDLPEQRSKEWYDLRKRILTASSLGTAIDRGHFQTRDELLLDKIVEKPYEPNEITEWGVKYEDVAIMFYEELYKVKVLDFGLIPHPEFNAFGASPDGICDDIGNDEYVGRMVEIKCPPRRKFTKTVPPHYKMQVQGQLEVCDLDECDFFQVKIEEYDSFDEYSKDIFIQDDIKVEGRTELNYPKGVVITYKNDEKLSYLYSKLNLTNQQCHEWIDSQTKENIHEIKWWKITRYECTLVKRDKEWWFESIDKILKFYQDLLYYQKSENIDELKNRVLQSKKRKKKVELLPLIDMQLISDDEDN